MEENEKDLSLPAEGAEIPAGNSDVPAPKKRKKKKKASFREKLMELWQDKRKFRVRLLTALAAAAALVFTFFIFGPFEIYITNMAFFAFPIRMLIGPVLLAGVIMIAVIAGILILLKGKIYNYAVSFVFSLTLAGYLQGNFFNIDHGSLDGASIVWQNFRGAAMWGMLLWAVIFIAPLALQYFSRKIWRRTVTLLSLILMGAQLVALISIAMPEIRNGAFHTASDSGYLSRDGIYTVSEQKNVVVFMLDRFDKEYADHQLYGDPSCGKAADPEIREGLKGFTYYENFTGSYTRTYPSVAYLLTGIKTDYSMPYMDYLEMAWAEGTFLSDIKNAGYDCRIYSDVTYMGGKAEFLQEEADNAVSSAGNIPGSKILSAMYTLSAYRYLPEIMKPYYHTYTGDLSYDYLYGDSEGHTPYGINDLYFRQQLLEQGLTVDESSKGTFLFYHLNGSHDPFTMDGNGNSASFSNFYEGRFEQTRGNLKTVFAYIDMLKEMGVYDDTTIIITADHGETGTYTELPSDRVLSLFIKPAGADAEAELQFSQKQICQDNLRASISSYFGLADKYGNRTIESIGETEEMVRYFWMNGSDKMKQHRDTNLVTYKITGDANDFSNWELISKDPINHPFYDAN